MKAKVRNILIAVCSLVLIGCFTVRYITINNKYPSAKIESYSLNEPMKDGDIEVTATGFRLEDGLEHDNPRAIKAMKRTFPDVEVKAVFVDVIIKNNGSETKEYPAYLMMLQVFNYSNGNDAELFEKRNNSKDATLNPTLKPNEEVKLEIPFIIYSINFADSHWKKIDTASFKLVSPTYPIQRNIELT